MHNLKNNGNKFNNETNETINEHTVQKTIKRIDK